MWLSPRKQYVVGAEVAGHLYGHFTIEEFLMSPAHEVFTGRRAEGRTRRELLEAGAAGLAGLGLVATRPAEAGAAVSAEPRGFQDQSTAKWLEAGRSTDVGMSQPLLDRVVDCLALETGQRHVTSASI